MPIHVIAWTELLGTTANTDIEPVVDSVLTISNAHFLPQRNYQLLWIAGMSATLNRYRLSTPRYRTFSPIQIRPIERGATPGNRTNLADFRRSPIVIPALEELVLEATSGIAMGTERFTAIAAITDQFVPAPVGDIYTIRGTSTTAATANVWSSLTVTWEDTLPDAVYAVVGGQVQSTNAQAFRLIFEGTTQQMRPGGLSVTALGNFAGDLFHRGGTGNWGEFRQTAMPTVQSLANGADASHEIYLDIVRVR